MDEQFVVRFRRRARALSLAAGIGFAVAAIGSGVLIIALLGERNGLLLAHGLAVATLGTVLIALTVVSGRYSAALRRIAADHPGGFVFLARRQPPPVSDLPAFLASKGLDVQISDSWYVGLAADDGISVWTPGMRPRRLLTIDWAEMGEVRAVRVRTILGEMRWSVTVDVKPYETPLIVDVGLAEGLFTSTLGPRDLVEVVAALEARRP